MTVGLHFSVEGINKFVDPKPFTAGFLVISKGPFAPLLKAMVWDRDGLARLDEAATKKIWQTYQQRAVRRFGFDANGVRKSEEILKTHEALLSWQLTTDRDEIREYQLGLKRLDAYRSDDAREGVASLRGQADSIERDLAAKRVKLLQPIEAIWSSYERDMNALGQTAGGRAMALPKVGRQLMDSELIDVIIKYFDVVVGVLLICGLFTRVASIAGGLFLLSICASQWPFYPGAAPIWYQLIEAMSMAVLAAMGAGQYAGFDYFYGPLRHWCCPPKQGTNA